MKTWYNYSKTFFINTLWVYIFWTLAHYISPHIYVKLCVPATITGFLLSPFMVPAPHCQALRWLIYQGGNVIVATWVLIGTWCMQLLFITNKHDEKI